MPNDIGKLLIYLGLALAAVGVLIHFGGKFFPLGKLPGDIHWEGANGSFYFPVVSCIVISIVLSVIANLFHK